MLPLVAGAAILGSRHLSLFPAETVLANLPWAQRQFRCLLLSISYLYFLTIQSNMRKICLCAILLLLLQPVFSQSIQPAPSARSGPIPQPAPLVQSGRVAQFSPSGQPSPSLQPGFNAREYIEMLEITAVLGDTVPANSRVPAPVNYTRQYRSKELGLKNRWDMWYRKDNQLGVISIRGTVNELPSWLENFYAAMVPANGSLQLNDSTRWDYQLAADSKAMVHVGWMVGLGYMAPTMVEQIRLARQKGIREFIIIGHSQGGALAFLTRSYLYYLTQKGELPRDIVFKTYCSAAPKPGNLFYAYDFDFITRNGWAFTVVNAADWVPETPFTVQTITDFNPVNPFINVQGALTKQPLLVRLYLKGKYNKMNRATRKAQQCFKSVLGDVVYKQVKKTLTQLRAPEYVNGNNYQRAGIPIVLQPDSAYYRQYSNDPAKLFQHHFFEPYIRLTRQYYGQQ
jgi:Lipase (class 3)